MLTAEEAIGQIKPGARIIVSHAASAPQMLLRHLVRQADRFIDNPVTVYHMVPVGYTGYLGLPHAIKHVPMFVGPQSRQWSEAYIPVPFSQIPRLIRQIGFDVALMTAPGISSIAGGGIRLEIGVSRDYVDAAINSSRLILCEINSCLPSMGWSNLTRSEVATVKNDEKIPSACFPKPTKEAEAIAENVMSLLGPRSTIQVGIGKLGGPILDKMKKHGNLRIHSEMFLDGMDTMLMNDPAQPATATFALGSQPLYAFMHQHPELINLKPVDYVNNPSIISRVDELRSICFATEADLYGQIVADCPQGKQVGGIGGIIDFAMGCSMNPTARFIVALPSSRIVERVVGPVAVTRELADTIVTEKGIAELKGKSVRDRRKAMEAIT